MKGLIVFEKSRIEIKVSARKKILHLRAGAVAMETSLQTKPPTPLRWQAIGGARRSGSPSRRGHARRIAQNRRAAGSSTGMTGTTGAIPYKYIFHFSSLELFGLITHTYIDSCP
jgi:hypothetical protein